MNDIQITVPGGYLVADPELINTPTGIKLAKMRVASTPRMKKGNEWVDAGATVFLDVVAWRTTAETVVASLHKGDRVTITGKLRQRNYETDKGAKRSAYELHADDIALKLRTATTEPAPETPAEQAAPTEAEQAEAPAA